MDGETVVFEVQGLHKLWAFKNRLEVPREDITGARHDPDAAKGWKGLRAPGTHVPGLITSGTYYLEGDRIFWDVRRAENVVVVDLEDQRYKQLVIEVEDPAAVVAMLGA
jgi:hypothetical protein